MADDERDASNPYGAPPPGAAPQPGGTPPPGPPPAWGAAPGQPPPGWSPAPGSPAPGYGPPGEPPAGWGPPPGQGWGPPPGGPGGSGGPGWGAPPPGYGYPGGPYYGSRETEPLAIVSLCLAIASWMICPLVLSIPAVVVGSRAQAAIAASGGRKEGSGLVTAARWIAWINIAVSLLVILAFIVLVAVGVSVEGSSESTEELTIYGSYAAALSSP